MFSVVAFAKVLPSQSLVIFLIIPKRCSGTGSLLEF